MILRHFEVIRHCSATATYIFHYGNGLLNAVQDFTGDATRGISLVSLHNGGGMGTGKSLNGGFGMVLDGSERMDTVPVHIGVGWYFQLYAITGQAVFQGDPGHPRQHMRSPPVAT